MKKLNLIDKAFLLKRTSIFESLDLDVLLAFADKLAVITYDDGDTIFPIAQEAHRMYFIAKGIVEISDQDSTLIESLSPPEFFGDESLFNGKIRGYQAVSKTDTMLLALSRTHLNMVISEAPSVALNLLQKYSETVSWRKREGRLS